ncbi:MAG: ADP-ribosylglycohydrolase family protein [candidate division KSB1 bacterium]|nr:ADP-ribosylglycohydrolase family protein [candidate division KSB1 bacterium]
MASQAGSIRDRFRGCLLGLAVGDALGTTVEFQPRGTFEPITDIVGGGPFGLAPGQWTDDTSMALCLATSLIECRGFDARDQMERYCRWWREGYLSSTGTCFDIGNTVAAALQRYLLTGDPYAGPTHPMSAGSGCIMRLAPVALFSYPDLERAERYAAESSRTTHGATECLDAARLLARILVRALLGRPKEDVLLGDRDSFCGSEKLVALAKGSYLRKSGEEIRGTGYVVDCLEAALWCFAKASDFREAVLMAVNLGDDADTTGAVCGQVAGAFWGESSIPKDWLARLHMADEIRRIADELWALHEEEPAGMGGFSAAS